MRPVYLCALSRRISSPQRLSPTQLGPTFPPRLQQGRPRGNGLRQERPSQQTPELPQLHPPPPLLPPTLAAPRSQAPPGGSPRSPALGFWPLGLWSPDTKAISTPTLSTSWANQHTPPLHTPPITLATHSTTSSEKAQPKSP